MKKNIILHLEASSKNNTALIGHVEFCRSRRKFMWQFPLAVLGGIQVIQSCSKSDDQAPLYSQLFPMIVGDPSVASRRLITNGLQIDDTDYYKQYPSPWDTAFITKMQSIFETHGEISALQIQELMKFLDRNTPEGKALEKAVQDCNDPAAITQYILGSINKWDEGTAEAAARRLITVQNARLYLSTDSGNPFGSFENNASSAIVNGQDITVFKTPKAADMEFPMVFGPTIINEAGHKGQSYKAGEQQQITQAMLRWPHSLLIGVGLIPKTKGRNNIGPAHADLVDGAIIAASSGITTQSQHLNAPSTPGGDKQYKKIRNDTTVNWMHQNLYFKTKSSNTGQGYPDRPNDLLTLGDAEAINRLLGIVPNNYNEAIEEVANASQKLLDNPSKVVTIEFYRHELNLST